MDVNSGSTQNFLVLTSTISFALFAASRAVETLKVFHGKQEDYRYLRSISLLSSIISMASILPLALSEVKENIEISSFIFAVLSSLLLIYTIYELLTYKIRLLFRRVSFILFAVSIISIIFVALNAFIYKSIMVYKIVVLWSVVLLCIRFYLIIGVVVSRHDSERLHPSN
jgi:hypothetical protein